MKFVGNRSFITISPKEPMIEWINSQDESKIDPEDIQSCKTLYMIEELEDDSKKTLRNYLKDNYDDIFYNELYSWYTNEEIYPEFSFDLFESWIDYELIEMCYDTKKSKLVFE